MRTLRLALAFGLALAMAGGASAGAAEKVYRAPYTAGPSGGDSNNRVNSADTASGLIRILRANPTPGVIGCAGQGGYNSFKITHTLTQPLKSVFATFEDATISNYTFLTVSVRDADGDYVGATKKRGPTTGDGAVQARLFDTSELEVGDTITILVGMELASACLNVDGGQATFTGVHVD